MDSSRAQALFDKAAREGQYPVPKRIVYSELKTLIRCRRSTPDEIGRCPSRYLGDTIWVRKTKTGLVWYALTPRQDDELSGKKMAPDWIGPLSRKLSVSQRAASKARQAARSYDEWPDGMPSIGSTREVGMGFLMDVATAAAWLARKLDQKLGAQFGDIVFRPVGSRAFKVSNNGPVRRSVTVSLESGNREIKTHTMTLGLARDRSRRGEVASFKLHFENSQRWVMGPDARFETTEELASAILERTFTPELLAHLDA